MRLLSNAKIGFWANKGKPWLQLFLERFYICCLGVMIKMNIGLFFIN